MKYFYTLLLAFILLPNLLMAQNLVPNPSFEDTTVCPTGTGQLNSATGWFSARSSPDFFHTCANLTTTYIGVPNNNVGSHQPNSGEGYIGLATYHKSYLNAREIVGVKLSSQLVPGALYFISAFISRADTAYGSINIDCASDKFGFRFSGFEYGNSTGITSPIDNFSHLKSDSIINDKTNWVQISGSFIADSTYDYLYLGNFYDDAHTNVTQCLGAAYYYIDDVCVSTTATTCNVVLSLPTIKQNIINLYPNPAKNKIAISNLIGDNYYWISNSTGTTVLTGKIAETNNFIDISNLPNGLYFFRLNNNHSSKFLISH